MNEDNAHRKLIVSLTTYPARIKYVRQVLNTIYNQTHPADQIILWLAEEQFPQKENDIPKNLMQLVADEKLTIRWCDDLKSHKKYFYALQEYPEDLIVTIDDDLLYHPRLLERLYASYLKHPYAVSAVRAHLITISETKGILPYKYWIGGIDTYLNKASMQLLCTGGAGALYPPHLFKPELFDKEALMNICPLADDLWLKTMELLSDVPVVVAEPYQGLNYVKDSQEDALYHQNVGQNQNDIQLKQICAWVEQQYGEDLIKKKLLHSNIGLQLTGMEVVCECYIRQNMMLQELCGSRIVRFRNKLVTWKECIKKLLNRV